MLTNEYVRHVYESEDLKAKLKMVNFDFHHFTKGDNFLPLKLMIQKIDTEILAHGWFIENLKKRSIERKQRGVIRTNCLDSLDRTNVA